MVIYDYIFCTVQKVSGIETLIRPDQQDTLVLESSTYLKNIITHVGNFDIKTNLRTGDH